MIYGSDSDDNDRLIVPSVRCRCDQCKAVGIDVEYQTTFVKYTNSKGGRCILCGYTLDREGMPVARTVLKVNKEGSARG